MIVLTVIFLFLAAVCFVLAVRSFKCRGFLFNNTYIYATPEQREKMNKKPYYKQTGIVFCLVGAVFLLEAAEVFFKKDWIMFISLGVIAIALVYAVISTVKSDKNKE